MAGKTSYPRTSRPTGSGVRKKAYYSPLEEFIAIDRLHTLSADQFNTLFPPSPSPGTRIINSHCWTSTCSLFELKVQIVYIDVLLHILYYMIFIIYTI